MNEIENCRACLSRKLLTFLEMGDQPPANAFVPPSLLELPQPEFPLNAQVCLDCGLIQVADNIPADFFRHYLYVPSGADTMHTHFAETADRLVEAAQGGLIIDVGCNDGLLLAACNSRGGKTLGVDPAANLAELARARGVSVHIDYFGPETADRLRAAHGPARVIVTTNTFNHVGDLHDFMEGVLRLLDENGVFVVEAPWARELLLNNEFDTIYHEHVSEFSLLSLMKLGAFFDLEVTDVQKLPVHGGSMRVFLARVGRGAASERVAAMLAEEAADRMLDPAAYTEFAGRVAAVGAELRKTLTEMKAQGLKLAGYGAPAKGNTLLNFFRIGPDFLDFLVDRNPLKQGLYSPGMKIPVRGPEAIVAERPDVLLVLAWNFLEEIKAQQSAFLDGGGRLLVPLPTPTLVGGEKPPATGGRPGRMAAE